MNEQVSPSEYLVISRGQWDEDITRREYRTRSTNSTSGWIGSSPRGR